MSSIDPSAYPVVIGDGGSTATTEGLPGLLAGPAADSVIDWGRVGDLHVRAATTRGRMHRFEGTSRQDSFGMGMVEGRALVLAVADGVSAAPQSHLASSEAVAAAVSFTVDALSGDGADADPADPVGTVDWNRCLAQARDRVLGLARRHVGDPELGPSAAADVMATTLTVALVDLDPSADGSRRVRVLAFGDVGAWVLRADGSWEPATPVKNAASAIAESSVAALPLEYDGEPVEHQCRLGPSDAFLLLSDGIGDPLGEGGGIVGSELARAWGQLPSPYQFAAWTDFARRTHTDDRTAVGVWPAR